MRYRLNESHSYTPKAHSNIAAVQRVSEHLAGGKTATEEELRVVLSGITNPHGDVVKWLARLSRRVIIPVQDATSELATTTEGEHLRITKRDRSYKGLSTAQNTVLSRLWSNPREVDLSEPLIYRIEIWSEDGSNYDYIGKARNGSRLREYDRNLEKIRAGKERGTTQKYRAVHFALFQAVQNGWRVECYPLENCDPRELNSRERQLITEYPCLLNEGKGWRVAEIARLSIGALLR